LGWMEHDRDPTKKLPPQSLAEELHARSLMTVPMNSSTASSQDSSQSSFGRMFVLDGRRRYSVSDLRWLERAATRLALPIENLFLLRHLRAQAVEAERRRLAGDLHDGLLQSLLSLNIQLDVLRHRVEETDKYLETELAGLQRVVQHEERELRRTVTDLRPLRIESADLPDMMLGLAQRFRQETGIALDVFIEDQDLRIPTRVCREIFQIYKESLQNIKKHARAGHVVVKLDHDETRALLVIDDNGEGFDFSGKYTGDELDNLRLGPISIKERARHVGGSLTLESNPGCGARLTIEIPLS
jgi:signal transduction histidine kinase